jgi:hypothetical protein
LWTEDFNNYILGNVATDVTGTPGQGNWYTRGYLGHDVVNENHRIEFEVGRGKYLILESTTIEERGVFKSSFRYMRNNIGSIWALKDSASNILKIEFEYNYNYYNNNSHNRLTIVLTNNNNGQTYNHSHGLSLYPVNNGALIEIYNGEGNNYLPNLLAAQNQWHKMIIYVDIDKNESYVEYPFKNYAIKTDHKNKQLGKYPYDPLDLNRFDIVFNCQDNFYGTSFLKIDNIKISAVNTLPTLNIIDLDSSKFNLYPNPAPTIVNIINSENLSIKQIETYDLAGKLIKTQNFNNETDIQLNVESLSSGIYMLHLQTKEGTAVKKLIKK